MKTTKSTTTTRTTNRRPPVVDGAKPEGALAAPSAAPATQPAPAPPLVPYVAVSESCHVTWLPDGWADDAVLVSFTSGGEQVTVAHFRVTPAVYAWVRERLARVEDQAYVPLPSAGAVDPDALVQPRDREAQRAAVRDALAVAVRRWRRAESWAERTYDPATLAAARPALPRPPDAGCRLVREGK